MTGRQENDLKVEKRIREMLAGKEPVLTDWIYSMSSSTPRTKHIYLYGVISYFEWLEQNGLKYDEVTYAKINRYINSIRYVINKDVVKENSATCIRNKIFAIKSFYKYLTDAEIIDSNPCDKIRIPAIKKELNVVAMTKEEVATVEETIEERTGTDCSRSSVIFQLGCMTGLRATAITLINLSDITFNEDIDYNTFEKSEEGKGILGGTIRVVDKGGYEKHVRFTANVGKTIWDYIKYERPKYLKKGSRVNALLLNMYGERITYETIRNTMKEYTDKLDKHITAHKMRATCATAVYEATGDIVLTQNMLDHKSVNTTRKYIYSQKEKLNEATCTIGKVFGF